MGVCLARRRRDGPFLRPQPLACRSGRRPRGKSDRCGDACVASLARSLAQAGDDLESIVSTAIAEAVATSAAAVTMPVAGEVDLPLREELLARITPIRLS